MSCNQCASKVNEEDGAYRCLDHGMQPKPSYRYIHFNQTFTHYKK